MYAEMEFEKGTERLLLEALDHGFFADALSDYVKTKPLGLDGPIIVEHRPPERPTPHLPS
jgi:hypothetical protein